MDLRTQLIESGTPQKKRGWKSVIASVAVHGAIIGLIVLMSMQATQKVDAENKPVHAFLMSKAAPPPPPPPPPPPAASHAASTPKVVKPVQVQPQPTFVQPTEIPQEVPKVEIPTSTTASIDPTPSNDPPGAQEGGVAGGVAGGVVGGQTGGTVGGEIGGQLGGVLGGETGGVVGGTVGGTGEGTGTEPAEGPLRVGGDVKAPVAISRAKPDYTDAARKGHVTGVVIVETIVNKQGEVEQVRVLKGLPLGLSDQAIEAVKKWRFKPGTLNGEPVEVIFTLTVNFTLE